MEQIKIIEVDEIQLNSKEERLLAALAVGLIFSIVTITALVVVADLHLVLKDWLKLTFYHHWIGKGILGTLAFVVSFLLTLLISPLHRRAMCLTNTSLWVSVLSTITIVLFFVYEAFLR